jgi:leucyl-tRNA synthetase
VPAADAQALVQYFHQRFHGASDVVPATAKALVQAHDLLTRYGVDQARYIVDFSVSAAQETDYHPQTFSGILHYLPRALADYEHAQQRKDAEARVQDERRRAQQDDERRAHYEAYRAERVAQLRASLPPDVLAAIEEAAAAHFEREHTSAFGREVLRRAALDHAVAAYGQIPSFAAWHPAPEPC